jgi:hypothetical protein
MESTPVSGVDIRKAVVAPLLAPCCRKPAAAGTTPQLQSGKRHPQQGGLEYAAERVTAQVTKDKIGRQERFQEPCHDEADKDIEHRLQQNVPGCPGDLPCERPNRIQQRFFHK